MVIKKIIACSNINISRGNKNYGRKTIGRFEQLFACWFNSYFISSIVFLSKFSSSFIIQYLISNKFFTMKAQMEDGLCMSIKPKLGALSLELKA
jgi:hypothetical protein